MKTPRRCSLVIVFLAGWLPAPLAAQTPRHAADVPSLVRATKPSVVELLCYDRDGKLDKTGSGFFISPDGKLLSNCHMLEGDSFSIIAQTTSGKRYSKMRILSAPFEKNYPIEKDVAELQFDDAKDVPYLSLGSSQNAAEGQRVLVIGNPEGLTGTVSDGIIAAFRKNGLVIQITAPISPGSSGSPVIDETGKCSRYGASNARGRPESELCYFSRCGSHSHR